MKQFALKIYQIQENTDGTDIEIISATEKVYDPFGLIGTATEDFEPLDLSPIEENIEVDEGIYRMDDLTLTVDGLDDTLFNSYGEVDDLWVNPYVLEVRDGSGLITHMVIDPDSIEYNARTTYTSFSAVEWLYLLAEKDAAAREVYETEFRAEAQITKHVTFDLPLQTDNGDDLSSIVEKGDIFQYKLNGDDHRTIVLEAPTVDDDRLLVRTAFAPQQELKSFTNTGTSPLLFSLKFYNPRSTLASELLYDFRIEFSQRSPVYHWLSENDMNVGGGHGHQIKIELDNGYNLDGHSTAIKLGVASWGNRDDTFGYIEGVVHQRDNFLSGQLDTDTNYDGTFDITKEPVLHNDDDEFESVRLKIFDHHLYGVANQTNDGTDPYGTDDIIHAIFHLNTMGVLGYVADSFTTTDFELDHILTFPKNPLETLRLIQNTHRTFLRLDPKIDVDGLPRFDVTLIDRKKVNTNEITPLTAIDVKDWTEHSGIDAPEAVVVRPETEYLKPKEINEVVGFYYEGIPDAGDRNRSIPKGDRVVEITVNEIPAYEGAEFGGNDGIVINDTTLKKIARTYWEFYSELKREADGTIEVQRSDMLGQYVTFNNVEDGRTIFVTKQSINLREGRTDFEGRIGEYIPSGTSTPVAKITGRSVWLDFDGDSQAELYLTARDSYDPVEDFKDLSFEWSLDNFSIIDGTRVNYEPTLAVGEHTIYLRVTNSQNNTDTISRDVSVREREEVSLVADFQAKAHNVTIQAQSFSTDIEFSVVDHETIQWTSGTLQYADGSSFTEAGGQSVISGIQYLFYNTEDEEVQVGDYQVAAPYPILATAKDVSDTAQTAMLIPVFGTMNVNEDSISARSIEAGSIKTNTITANEITGASLSAIYADMGTLVSGEILVGDGTPDVDLSGWHINADSGEIIGQNAGTTELKFDTSGRIFIVDPPNDGILISGSGIKGYSGSVLQAQMRNDGKIEAAAGDVLLDEDGIHINIGSGADPSVTNKLRWTNGPMLAEIYAYDVGDATNSRMVLGVGTDNIVINGLVGPLAYDDGTNVYEIWHGSNFPMASTNPSDGDVLKWNATDSQWEPATDESGGTDADTLDGEDGTYYLDRTNHTGTQAASTIGSGTFADARISQSSVTQHESALSIAFSQITGTVDADTLDGYDITAIPRKAEFATISETWTFNDSIRILNSDLYLRRGSLTGDQNMWHQRNAEHTWRWLYRGQSNNYIMNLYAYDPENSGALLGKIWTINHNTQTVSFDNTPNVDGNTVWHSGNDGSGSELDADMLDGLHESAFARLAQDETVSGSWTFDPATSFGTNVGSTDFASGALGAGWRMTYGGAQSFLEIDNLRVRGSFRTHIFQKNVIRASNGYFFFTDSAASVEDNDGSSDHIRIKDDGTGSNVFQQGDLILYRDIADDGSTGSEVRMTILQNGQQVTNSEGEDIWRYSVSVDSGVLTSIKAGGTFVRVGNDGTVGSRDGSVFVDSSGPFIDVYDNVDEWADFDGTAKVKVRLGDVSGITHATLNPSGYGLYSENVFLEGEIVANSGEIGGWSIGSTTLVGGDLEFDAANARITAGTGDDIVTIPAESNTWRLVIGNATFSSAPFRVDKNGAVTATNATITGTITATDGAIGGWTIESNRLDNNSVYIAADYALSNVDATTSTAWFGYQSGGNLRGMRLTGDLWEVLIYQNDGAYPSYRVRELNADGTTKMYRAILGDMNNDWNSAGNTWDGIGLKIFDASGDLIFGQKSSDNVYVKGELEIANGDIQIGDNWGIEIKTNSDASPDASKRIAWTDGGVETSSMYAYHRTDGDVLVLAGETHSITVGQGIIGNGLSISDGSNVWAINKHFHQSAMPTSGASGETWEDSDNGNIYMWSDGASAWLQIN